uniref:Di19 C-terminal domain-containing protein n=1 Tax=Salix viminalis TaxID=40686 RepID=A0A6N2ME94_SALVM
MDADFWTSRVHSAKKLSAIQAATRNSGKGFEKLEDEESKKKPVENTPHIHSECGYWDECVGEELNGFDNCKRLDFVIDGGLSSEKHWFWSSNLTDFALGYVSTGNHLAMDDSDGDDNSRAYFPCPFCYVEIEVHVCPLCAANLGKDAIEHFIVHHASSMKHRRKHKKSGLLTGSSAMLGKDLSSFLGSSTNSRTNTHGSSHDPLLSPFLVNPSPSDPRKSQHDEPLNKSVSDSKSPGMSSLDGGNQVDYEEQRQKSTFVQQLIASTIL